MLFLCSSSSPVGSMGLKRQLAARDRDSSALVLPISAFVFDILSYELTQPLIVTSQYSLFGQISLVLALNAELNESTQLLSLDSLDLKSFVLDTLTNLASFF